MSSFSPGRADQILQRIERSTLFQGSVIFIIVLSAITIGAKTYELPGIAERLLPYLDNAITVFFLGEIILRFLACDHRGRFFTDGWNVFDTLVVVGSLIPLDNADAVLIGRLLRVFRVLRLVSVVPELRSLINALLKSIPRMGHIALLMFIIFYIYGAIGSLFFATINETLWGDVAISMLTLFRIATFEDWTDVMYETMATFPLSWIYYLTFIFLTAFVFLNMMVGTILDVMTQEFHRDSDERAHQERDEMSERLASMETQLADIRAHLLKDAHIGVSADAARNTNPG
ncbi:MAG: ion transporter [Chromatocurvus sp.]